MADELRQILARAIDPGDVVADGVLTRPRSYGVYLLSPDAKRTRRWRFGNHPIRQRELEAEFGGATLQALFLNRDDAREVARLRNGERRR
jgi:hypothetical protein